MSITRLQQARQMYAMVPKSKRIAFGKTLVVVKIINGLWWFCLSRSS